MATFKEMGIDSFPLSWPSGWVRTKYRSVSKFRTSFTKARYELFREIKLLGCSDYNVILSTNIPLRRDGLPYANQANPEDPGVAVYFRLKDRPMVFACDKYRTVTENLYAITKTIQAIRGIKRWGASEMMERTFTGFQALPPPKAEENWWEILDVPKTTVSFDVVKKAWKKLALKHHPDVQGGSEEMMAKINQAYANAMKDLGRDGDHEGRV